MPCAVSYRKLLSPSLYPLSALFRFPGIRPCRRGFPRRDGRSSNLSTWPHGSEHADTGELLLVIPRPGTISAWASKATDIAHNCGLAAISRIERGIAYGVATRGGEPLSGEDRATLLPFIHDRMTEAVFPSLDDAARLFTHFAPRPLATIDLLARGRAAIHDANRQLASRSRPTRSTIRRSFSREGPIRPPRADDVRAANSSMPHKTSSRRSSRREATEVVFAMIRHAHGQPAGAAVA